MIHEDEAGIESVEIYVAALILRGWKFQETPWYEDLIVDVEVLLMKVPHQLVDIDFVFQLIHLGAQSSG